MLEQTEISPANDIEKTENAAGSESPFTPPLAVGIGILLSIFLAGYFGLFETVNLIYAKVQLKQVEQIAFTILLIASAAWFFEILPLFVTALLVLAMALLWLQPTMALTQKISPDVFTAPFFSDVIMLFLGGFVISRALEKEGLTVRLVRLIVRYGGKNPSILLLSMMLFTAAASIWLSNTSTTVMMLAVVGPLLRQFPYESKTRKGFLLGIAFAASMGGLGSPVGTPPNAIIIGALRDIDLAPSFMSWMAFGIPSVLILTLLTWGLILLFPGRSREPMPELNLEDVKPYTVSTWMVLLVSVFTAAAWMASDFHSVEAGTIALIPCILFFGSGYLSTAVLRTISWDVLLLMGGGLCLGEVIAHSGLAKTFVAALPLDQLSPYMLTITFTAIACLLSILMSNTATAALMMPLAVTLPPEAIVPVSLGIAFGCSVANALPVSTPPNTLAFSMGGLKSSDMVVPGTLSSIAGIAYVATIGWWLWTLLGLR